MDFDPNGFYANNYIHRLCASKADTIWVLEQKVAGTKECVATTWEDDSTCLKISREKGQYCTFFLSRQYIFICHHPLLDDKHCDS